MSGRGKEFIRRLTRPLGVEFVQAARQGIDPLRDVDRIRPLASFRAVVDVGAHHGETALHYAHAMPNATVFSFEPVASNYDALRRNVGGHPRIVTTNSAVGPNATQAPIYAGGSSQTFSLSPSAVPDASVVTATVSVISLDDFAATRGVRHVDLLKTDTEGYDLEVLRGCAGLLSERQIDFIYSEATLAPDDTSHTSFSELLAFLGPMGYRALGLYEVVHSGPPYQLEYCNALFTCL